MDAKRGTISRDNLDDVLAGKTANPLAEEVILEALRTAIKEGGNVGVEFGGKRYRLVLVADEFGFEAY